VVAAVVLLSCGPSPSPTTRPASAAAPKATRPQVQAAIPQADPNELADDDRKRAEEATVFIEVKYRPLGKDPAKLGSDDYLRASGSGVIVGNDGLILTNAHVVHPIHVHEPKMPADSPAAAMARARMIFVRDSVDIWIHCGTPRAKRLTAQVLCTRDNPNDLALLRVAYRQALKLTALPVADGVLDESRRPALKNGQKVWASGFPLGRSVEEAFQTFKFEGNPNGPDIAIRPGFVSSLRHGEAGRLKLIEHSSGIEPGNSGGPLVNARGELLGLNTWGYESSKKYDYAIPLQTIHGEFAQILRTMGHRTVATDGPARRVLIVEPSDEKDTATRFRTLAAAVEAARDGDVIDLNEGEHKVDSDITVARSIWIRGSGRTKTTLKGKRLWLKSAGYVEVSDLETDDALIAAETTGREAFIHDANFAEVHAGGSANIVGCQASVMYASDKSTARIERAISAIQVTEANPTLLGCQLREGGYITLMSPGFRKSAVTMTGCSLYYRMVVEDSGCTFRNNLLTATLSVTGKSGHDTTFEGNRFEGASVQMNTGGSLKSNLFVADRFTSVGVMSGARVWIEENYFHFPGRSYVRKNDDGSEEAPPAVFTYGLAAVGKDSRAIMKGNLFISRKRWGKAYEGHEAGEVVDDGHNAHRVVQPTDGVGIAPE
jgi:S1-C subfamily serine protease